MINHISILKKEIISAINDLQLDLSGLTILTEAGSNLFVLTPIIAKIAGAKKIYALTKNTKFGTVKEIEQQLKEISSLFDVDTNHIEIVEKELFNKYKEADIITNLGHVRPINETFLKQLNNNAVISYMCEAWEHREKDLDLELCQKYNIPVFATDEDHPFINCFEETGLIALKMIFESKVSLINSKVSIISRDKFGKNIYNEIKKHTNNVILYTDLKKIELTQDDDILIIADYLFENEIIGSNGLINPHKLKSISPNVMIIQYCGMNNLEEINRHRISIYPQKQLEPVRMYYTLADISYKAFIRLMTGGLKVGEGIYKAKKANNNNNNIIHQFLVKNNYPAQNFYN